MGTFKAGIKRGQHPRDVLFTGGSTIGASDAIELNIDATKITKGDALQMLDDVKAAIHARPYPPVATTWQIVGQYGDLGESQFNHNATNFQYRRGCFNIDLASDVTALRVLVDTVYVDSGQVEQPIGNVSDYRCGYWQGGVLIGKDTAATTVASGAAAVLVSTLTANLAAGSRLSLRRQTHAVTGTFTAGTYVFAAGTIPTNMGFGTSANDIIDVDTATPTLTVGGFNMEQAGAVIGLGVHTTHTYMAVGTSIERGNAEQGGDGGLTGDDTRADEGGGWMRRTMMAASKLIAKPIPFLMRARVGATALSIIASGGAASAQMAYSPYCDTLIVARATNDAAAGRTADQIRADNEATIRFARGMWQAANGSLPYYVIVTTAWPRSIDATTPAGYAAVLRRYNHYVRTGRIAGANGYWDPNFYVAALYDEMRWYDPINDTSDFTHPLKVACIKPVAFHSALVAAANTPAPPGLARPNPWIEFDLPLVLYGAPIAGTSGSAFGFYPVAKGGARSDKLFGLSGALPAGLVFSASDGSITGTPTQTGSYPVRITAGDASGTTPLSATITVS